MCTVPDVADGIVLASCTYVVPRKFTFIKDYAW